MADWPLIRTRVSRQDWTDHYFRGHGVFAELSGRTGFWRMMALAVGGPALSEDDCQVLDDVCDSTVAADPRIPALKLARLVGAYGNAMAAFASVILPLEGALLGPWSSRPAAEMLMEVAEQLGHDATEADVEVWLQSRFADRKRVHGYGVPARPRDERMLELHQRMLGRGRAERPYWRLLGTVEAVMRRLRGWSANLSSGYAAVLLDLGFAPTQIPLMGVALVLPSVAGNAQEAGEEPAPLLQRLPSEWTVYQGPAARLSPRAAGG